MTSPGGRAHLLGPPLALVVALGLALATGAAMLVHGDEPRWRWLVVATALHAVLVLAAPVRRAVPLGLVAVAAPALLAVALVAPPHRSADVWAYATYGHMAAAGHPAYTHVPAAYPRDPFVARMNPGWRTTREVYGPVFHGLERVGASMAGRSPLRARLWFQGLAAASAAVALGVVWRSTRDREAVTLLGLCPALLVGTVHEAHNDVLVGALLLGAVVLVRRGRDGGGVALAAAAVLVKVSAGLPLLALLAWLAHARGRRVALRATAVAAAMGAVGYALVGGPSAVSPALHASSLRSSMTLWRLFLSPTAPSPVWLRPASLALVLALVLGVVWVRRSDPDPGAGVLGASLAFVLAATYALPWYHAWGLPTAARARASRTAAAAFLLAGASVVAYGTGHPFASGRQDAVRRFVQGGVWPAVQLAAVGVLAAFLIGRSLNRRRARPVPSRPDAAPPLDARSHASA